MSNIYGRPLGPNTSARSTASADELTEAERLQLEREEYELYKAHMRDRIQRAEYDRMERVSNATNNLKRIRDSIFVKKDPVVIEIFLQIAAIKSELAAIKSDQAAFTVGPMQEQTEKVDLVSTHGEAIRPTYDLNAFDFFAAHALAQVMDAPEAPRVILDQWKGYSPPSHLVAEDAAKEQAAADALLAAKKATVADAEAKLEQAKRSLESALSVVAVNPDDDADND